MKLPRHIIPKIYKTPEVYVVYWLCWEFIIPRYDKED